MTDQQPPINPEGGTGTDPYGPPNPSAQPAPSDTSSTDGAGEGSLGAGADLRHQQLQNVPLQNDNPRVVYNFGKEEILPGPGDFSALAPPPPPPPPGYETQFTDPSKQANWDKLSPMERWVQQALPAVSGTFADAFKKWDAGWGHSVDTTLTIAAGSPVGKPVVNYFQWGLANLSALLMGGFTAINRGAGFASQAQEAAQSGTLPQFNAQLKAAWYAGDLQADVAPNTGPHVEQATGPDGQPTLNVVTTDNQLGGVVTLVQARQRISDLMAQGMSAHDALIQTRSEWYGKLGALAFRAQSNNFLASLAVNPIGPVLETLRPVEQVQAVRTILTGMQATDTSTLETAVTAANDALKVAEATGDADKIAAATATAEQTQSALDAAGRTRLTWGQQKLVKIFGLGSEEQGAKNIIGLSGGVPGKGNFLSAKWNPFALTPEARTSEYLTILNDNLTSYHIAANTAADGSFDPEGFARGIQRVADGASDPRMGNMLLTLEGRSVKAAVGGFAQRADEMLTAWKQTGALERPLLEHIAQVLGDTPESVMARLADGDPGQAALLNQYMQKAVQIPEAQAALADLLARNNLQTLDAHTIARVFHVLKDVPYTDQKFLAQAVNEITDHTAQQALAQFGVKQSGVIRRIAEMTKAAESLAHFRVNPAYPIRMFITDTMNMLRDGTFGTMSNGEINAFWDTLGFEPGRLYQSTGYTGPGDFAGAENATKTAGPMVAAQSKGQQAIYHATNAASDPIQKVTRWLGSIKPPDVLNAQNWARDITAMASRRSYTTGYIRGMGQFMPAAVGKVIDFSPDLAAQLGPDLSRTFENALGSVKTEAELDAMLAHPNLNLTTANVLDTVQTDTGLKLDQVLGPEVQAKIDPIIRDAAATGDKAAVPAAFKQVKQAVQDHLDTLHAANLSAMQDEALAKTVAEKSGAFPKVWSQVNDEIISAQIKHTMDQAYNMDALNSLGGKEAAAAWASQRAGDEAFFGRAWERGEAQMQGLVDGAKIAGLPGGDELMAQFQSWKGDAQNFIADRNKLWNDFWEAKASGATPPVPYDQIVVKTDNGYRALIERERAWQQSLDAGISKMLPPDEQPAFLAWRNRTATLRTGIKQAIVDFRQTVRGLRGPQLEDAYKQFSQEHLGRLGQLQYENSAGQAMMQGEPRAAERYTQSVATAKQEMDTLDTLMPAKLEGNLQLPPEQQAQLDAVVKKYATPEEADKLAELRNQATTERISPPTRVKAMGPDEEAAWQQQAIAEATGAAAPSARGIDFEHARQMGPDKTGEVAPGAPKGAEVFDYKSKSIGIDGKNQNRWTFDPGTDFVQAPKVWTNEARTEWQLQPPSARGATLRYGNKVVKLKTMADTLIAANGEVWKRMPANEIDGWVEKFAQSAGYDLGGENINWDTISHDLSAELKAENAPKVTVDGQDIPGFSPDVLKNNPELLAQLAPQSVPRELDTERLAANQDARAQQQMQIEWDVWQRMSQAADQHAVANAQAQTTTEGLAGTASAEMSPPTPTTETPAVLATPEQTPTEVQQTEPVVLNATHPDTVHQTAPGIPDIEQVVKPSLFQNKVLDELMFTRGQPALDAMQAATLKLMDQAPVNFGNFPAEAQAGARGMIEKAYGDLADARYASMRYGEYTRDSALLNYNRRYNFDSWLSNIAPYEFWTTHSAFNWFIHSVDRPAMLASYLRFKQFMDTAGVKDPNFPTRLQGTLKIPLPFMPDFMGHSVYIDPLKLGLPFEGWQAPFDRYAAQEQTDLGAAGRELQSLVNAGKITAAEQADALKSHAGPVWERAVAQAQLNDQQGGQNYMNLLTSLLPPHLPLLYAYDAAQAMSQGKGAGDAALTALANHPIAPITRTLDGLLATLGVKPGLAPGGPEAAIRRALGLHGFGQWDNYYAEREITNELGLSKISVDDARQAMLTHAGPVWEEAMRKAAIETSGGGPMGALLGLAGVPVKGYPPGEEYLRSLAPEYKAAWAAYDGGDMQALNKFNDAHPGYEERLALFKTPEARLHQFTEDQFFNVWHNLPTLTRDELKKQLSPDFAKMVTTNAPGETTSPEVKSFRRNVSSEQMAVWLKLMGATPVGSLGTEAKPLVDVGGQTSGPNLDLASPELAQRAQVFYQMRTGSFPDWYAQQKGYFDIPAGQKVDLGPRDQALASQYLQQRDAQFGSDITALVSQYFALPAGSPQRRAMYRANPKIGAYESFRANFKAANPGFANAIGFNDTVKENTPTARSLYYQQHPQLTSYLAWRDDFLKRNPDLAPYLSDHQPGTTTPYPKVAMQAQPQYTRAEWQMSLGWNLYNLIQDSAHDPRAYPLSPVARDALAKKAAALGYKGTADDLARIVAGAP